MTREEAMNYLERIKQEYDCSYEEEALDMAIKALEQQSMPTIALPDIDKEVESYKKLLKHPVIKSIMGMDETQEQLDFVQPHKRIPVTLTVSGDVISRQVVLDMLEDINAETEGVGFYYEHYVDYIKNLPPVTPQQTWIPVSERLPKHYDSHDLIHRETARRIIDSPRTKEQMLMVLASAENQKKTGHWVYEPRKRLINETDEGREYITEYWCKCSECGGDFGFQKMSDAYCKYCGARMESKQNG